MAIFPELAAGLKTFMRGFEHSQKMDIVSLAVDAPPIEHKGMFSTGLGGGYGYGGWSRRYRDGSPNWADEPVNLDTAQSLSAVYACRRIICETYASLPFQLMQRPKPGEIVFRRDLPIWDIMEHGNDERSDFSIRETMTSHLLFYGNAYAEITRRSGSNRTALDIEVLLPWQVQATRERDGQRRLKYVVHDTGRSDRTFFVNPGEPQDILHVRGAGFDGLIGYSILEIARQSLGTCLGMEKNLGRFWANGGRAPYYLKRPKPFPDDASYEEFRSKWKAAYSEPHNVPILEGDLTYESIGLSLEDAQLLETRKFSVSEICRWFGVSPSLVYDLSKANYASLEQLIRSFINFSMRGWMERWAADFRRCVLTPQEKKQGIYVHHDLKHIEKGDFKSRMEAYSTALQNGIFSIDQVLEKEGEEPVGLNKHLVQMQMTNAADRVDMNQTPEDIDVESEESD